MKCAVFICKPLRLSFLKRYIHSWLQRPAARKKGGLPAPYQDLQQLLQVAGDEGVVFVEGPAALLRVVAVAGEVAEDHLQALLIVTHLTLRQRCAQVLQRHQKSCDSRSKPEKPVARGKFIILTHKKADAELRHEFEASLWVLIVALFVPFSFYYCRDQKK